MTRALFSLEGNSCQRIASWMPSLERDLHRFMDQHLKTTLGLNFLASEWTLPGPEGMRLDTIAIDDDGFPVVIEYKKLGADNILNQALYYLTHLQQHKGDFVELVRGKMGDQWAASIDWRGARVVCIAHEFNPYDLSAVDQTRVNLDLIAFEFFSNNTFELNVIKTRRVYRKPVAQQPPDERSRLTFQQMLTFASANVQKLAGTLVEALKTLDDEIYCTDSRDGLILTTMTSEIGRLRLSGNIHPRLKVVMNSHPDQTTAVAFPGLKVGQDGAQVSLTSEDQLQPLIDWIADQAARSLR